MLDLIADLLGAALGSLFFVNAFRAMAGVRFSHWRHIAIAYLVFFLFAIPTYAVTSVVQFDKPLDFTHTYAYAIGALVGAAIELTLLRYYNNRMV